MKSEKYKFLSSLMMYILFVGAVGLCVGEDLHVTNDSILKVFLAFEIVCCILHIVFDIISDKLKDKGE